MVSLLQKARFDIEEFLLRKDKELLFNERDFQMHLATFLRHTSHYDDVDVEYYVPFSELKDYIWENELRLDILLRKADEFLPIELKYKTKLLEKNLKRFNENLAKVTVMKNQGAQDLAMYDFWKDVRRIELVRNRFSAVKNGLAIFLTNDKSYLNTGRNTSNNFNFNMCEGIHHKEKHWLRPEVSTAKGRPNFDVEKDYNIHWNKSVFEEIDFNYCIVEI